MTQTERIIKHLKEHGSITPLEAIKEYGITRLGARIWWDMTLKLKRKLQKIGLEIKHHMPSTY